MRCLVLRKQGFGLKRWLTCMLAAVAMALPMMSMPAFAKTTAKTTSKSTAKTAKAAAKASVKTNAKSSKAAKLAKPGKAGKLAAAHVGAGKKALPPRYGKAALANKHGAKAAAGKTRLVRVKRGGRWVRVRMAVPMMLAVPAVESMGHQIGLQRVDEGLELKSSVAFVIDQETNEVLLNKNSRAILPIASITKLMTAVIVSEANLPMEEMLTVTQEDLAATAGSRSRLALGTELSRNEMLHLALMSSENRAAHVLGRSYPGGMAAFVAAMNLKAKALGMNDTRYVEPTGLSMDNRSSAQDLSRLVRAAYKHSNIRDLSTSLEANVAVGEQHTPMQFRNTNGLVRNPDWDIGLQKTGYITAAGRCLVMQAQMAGRKLIMVLLDSAGKYSRLGDAERIKNWLVAAPAVAGTGLAVQAQ
jgi:serine-type D-Ala-D-Ala endopeptidase (penicillin-binding protein 7)